MPKTVTIIRHAQSKFNAGQYTTETELSNCRLSDFGREQSKNLTQTFDILILSPLKRAIETYANSNIKCGNVIINDLFREYKEHDPKPLNFLELETIMPETLEEVKKRVGDAINYLKTSPYNNIGIISHGIFICYFLEQLAIKQNGVYNCQAFVVNLSV
jgi:broad specificity phosphatase PhoE